MTFMRLKTDHAGRVYLYEETRTRIPGKKNPHSVSRSHGRVDGFWFYMAVLIDNLSEIFQTKTHGVNQGEDERQTALKIDEERDRDRQKLWSITHPGWAAPGVPEQPITPPVSEVPPDVPAHPEEPESAVPNDDSEEPEAPEATTPDPDQSGDTADPDAPASE